MSVNRVVVVGATGAVGEPVVKALLEAGFEVTAFTRASSKNTFPPGVKVAAVDYEDVESLTKELQGQDALVSTIGFGGASYQKNLLDASIAAGVKRFLPSEFGCDLENEKAAALPIFAPKVEVESYAKEKVKDTSTSYTSVYTNAFLDWGLVNHGLLLDLPGKKIQLIDGGETPFTATPLDFIARGVVAILRNLDATANRAVRLNGAVVTLNELWGYAKKHAGGEGWEVEQVTAEALEQKAYKALKEDPANPWGYTMEFIKTAIYKKGLGGEFVYDDDELLGLKKLTGQEVEEVVKRLVQ
ncbi:hypothetical protein LTR53_008700 [Teratosphaeriaceae sp. CCFEE 6253]|nr:hypothetical protein LTR53_008700 [Teratosphaeriaceae sp. CCFEE 6253]